MRTIFDIIKVILKILYKLPQIIAFFLFILLFYVGGWGAVKEFIIKITTDHPLIIGGYAFLKMIFE